MAKRKTSLREKGGLRYGEGYVMERATATGITRYAARWLEGYGIDARWRCKTFDARDTAEDHLREVARQKRRGTYTSLTTMTVRQAVETSIERRKSGWRAATYVSATKRAESRVYPVLGSRKVASLTAPMVQDWLDGLAADGLTQGGIRNLHALVATALDDLVRIRELPDNVARQVRRGGKPGETPEPWSRDEAHAVLTMLHDDAEAYAYYLLALSTGMRPGELDGLRWADVDLDTGTIRVAVTVTVDHDGQRVLGHTTKTGKVRAVTIDAPIITALRSSRAAVAIRRLAAQRWTDLDLVFPGHDGTIRSADLLRIRHRDICERAGVHYIRLHDLRHTYATVQAELGTHPRSVMETMGHRKLPMTMERYTHATTAMRRTAAETIAAALVTDTTTTTSNEDKNEDNLPETHMDAHTAG